MRINPLRLVITLFGIGYLPKAPGTWASLATTALGGVILLHVSLPSYLLCVLVSLVVGMALVRWARPGFDSADPPEIVLDEFIGQLTGLWPLALILYCTRAAEGFHTETLKSLPFLDPLLPTLAWLYVGSLLMLFAGFRFFDIRKPSVIGWLDRSGGLAGIVLDDFVAGLVSGFIFFVVVLLCVLGMEFFMPISFGLVNCLMEGLSGSMCSH